MNHLDHSGHDGMDHGDHGDGGMDMGGKCSMNMLWNTQIIDTCIIFPQWHIRSHTSFILSFLSIVALGIFYEWLRFFTRRVDRSVAQSLAKGKSKSKAVSPSRPTSDADGDAELLTGSAAAGPDSDTAPRVPRWARKGVHLTQVPPPARALRAVLYGAQVFLSFFLMLIFMTYNAYLILAVVLGAAIGHYYLGGQLDVDVLLSGGTEDKGVACH